MNITLDGHFGYRRLVRSALPGILMMLVSSVYVVVDGLFVSNFVGTTAFAAVNVIWPVFMLIGALGLMVGAGGTALIAATRGRGDHEGARRIFSMLVQFTVVLAFAFMVPMFLLMEPLARLLGAEGEMLRQCVIYGRICTIGLPGFMLQVCFQSFYMTAEKPELGTAMSLVCAVANMALDALFIVVFRWGIAGAAAASMAACLVGGAFPVWYFSSRRNTSALKMVYARFDRGHIRQTCSNGLSEYVGNISFNVLGICYNLQLLRMMGENGVAAYSALLYYGGIFTALFFGYNIMVTPVIGFNYGAGDRMELSSLLRHSLLLLLVLGSAITLASEVSARGAARIFVGYDPVLTDLTARAIRISMPRYVLAGINFFASAWFTGLGNGKVSAALSLVRNVVLETGFVFLFPAVFGPGSIWLAVVASEVCCCVLTVTLFLSYRKKYGY